MWRGRLIDIVMLLNLSTSAESISMAKYMVMHMTDFGGICMRIYCISAYKCIRNRPFETDSGDIPMSKYLVVKTDVINLQTYLLTTSASDAII